MNKHILFKENYSTNLCFTTMRFVVEYFINCFTYSLVQGKRKINYKVNEDISKLFKKQNLLKNVLYICKCSFITILWRFIFVPKYILATWKLRNFFVRFCKFYRKKTTENDLLFLIQNIIFHYTKLITLKF